jgi:hypothetical protein
MWTVVPMWRSGSSRSSLFGHICETILLCLRIPFSPPEYTFQALTCILPDPAPRAISKVFYPWVGFFPLPLRHRPSSSMASLITPDPFMTATIVTDFNEIAIRAPRSGFLVGDCVYGEVNPLVRHYELGHDIPPPHALCPVGSQRFHLRYCTAFSFTLTS